MKMEWNFSLSKPIQIFFPLVETKTVLPTKRGSKIEERNESINELKLHTH